MNIEEFLNKGEESSETISENSGVENQEVSDNGSDNLDVQRAVVEELAADKAQLDEELCSLRSDLSIKEGQVKAQNAMIASLHDEIKNLKAKLADTENRLAAELERKFDEQARNPNALALLDRDVELPDRFPGETRDHILEVLKEAREKAERDGRIRLAQVLEGVLVANEPNGSLAEHRAEMQKIFEENNNVINGTVIAELKKRGIAHKNGEEYLLASEIIKRTY